MTEPGLEMGSLPAIAAYDVLIVDDDEPFCEVMQLVLESASYRVVATTSAREALNILLRLKQPPGLVLLDLVMPGFGAEELVREMKKVARLASIPVILFSGSRALEARCRALACAGWLPKPADLDAICEVVDRHLDRH